MNWMVRRVFQLASFSALLLFPSFTRANDFSSAESEEANLRSITFIDPDRGWAAGERGTILRSQDGGLNWQEQPTPTRSDLHQIAMFNSQRGLAIGGGYRPYTQLSRGEVLTTRDGGATWQQAAEHNLPLLRKVIIGRGGLCIAAGDWSSVYFSSLFLSKDGGETWSPLSCDLVGNVVDLVGTAQEFLVLSDCGQLCRIKNQSSCETLVPPRIAFGNQTISKQWSRLMADQNRYLLIGSDGVLSSDDSGQSWQAIAPTSVATQLVRSANGPLPWAWHGPMLSFSSGIGNELTTSLDGSAIANRSAIKNRIHGMCHLNGERLWACGDFGTILASRDQGKTWRPLRGSQPAIALLVFTTKPAELPWNLLATESLQANRRIGIACLNSSLHANAPPMDALRQAANRLGPCSVFALPAATDSNAVQQANGTSVLDEHITACLAVARPAVIVVDQSLSPEQRDRLAAIALEAGVKRFMEIGERAGQTVHLSAAIPAAGGLASDYWHDAAAILAPGQNVPVSLTLHSRFDSTGSTSMSDVLASVTARDPQYTLSRRSLASRRNLQLLQARSLEATWKTNLLRSASDLNAYQVGLQSILTRMQPQDRDRLWVELCMAANRLESPAAYQQTLQYMQTSSSDTASTDASAADRDFSALSTSEDLRKLAALRLMAIANSREWQVAFGGQLNAANAQSRRAIHSDAENQVSLAVEWSPFQKPTNTSGAPSGSSLVTPASFTDSGTSNSSVVQAAATQNTLGSGALDRGGAESASMDLYWDTHPLVELQREKSDAFIQVDGSDPANSNSPQTSSRLANKLNAIQSAAGWSRLLGVIDRIPPGNGDRNSGELLAGVVPQRPFLDGKFEEPWWRSAAKIVVEATAGQANVQAASDSEFIYFALTLPPLNSSLRGTATNRDVDLSNHARYRLRLDVDCDLLTSYVFEFDGNGNSRESCDGFSGFDPKWYLASHHSEESQQIEIAIQKSDLGIPGDLANPCCFLSLDIQSPADQTQALWLPDPADWFPLRLP